MNDLAAIARFAVRAIERLIAMGNQMTRSYACDLPNESGLRTSLPRIDYMDSFAVPKRVKTNEMTELYAAALDHLPKVFKHLLVIRSALVRPFGVSGVSLDDLQPPIDTTRAYAVGDMIGRWKIYQKGPNELVTGADDRHLDFRVSLLRDGEERIVLSTAVMAHNRFGRFYLASILPFHRFGVSHLLTRASAAGRL
jgi:hypothetical protein